MIKIQYSDGTYELIDDNDLNPEDVNYDRMRNYTSYKNKSVEFIMDNDFEEQYE